MLSRDVSMRTGRSSTRSGIHLSVDKPADGFSEQENYSLAPEAFHLPPIAFTDAERAALQTALTLLDGEFAYAEPLRLALQQITWGRPSPLGSDSRQTIGLGITASAGGGEVSARLAKIDTAIYRRKRIEFEYHTMESDKTAQRKRRPVPPAVRGRAVLPRRLLARAQGRARLPALADPRQGRLRDQGRARLPAPGRTSTRAGTRTGSRGSSASSRTSPRSRSRRTSRGTSSASSATTGRSTARVFRTGYAIPRLLISWALEFGLRIVGPPALVEEARRRVDDLIESHRGEPPRGRPDPRARAPPVPVESNGRGRGAEPRSARSASRGSSRSRRC